MVFGRMSRFGRSSGQETQAEAEAQNDDEAAVSNTAERPGIADKVRFWEEQDRINSELIPRVLKQNELLSAHVASHEEVRVQTTTINSRMDDMAERYKREMAELEARTTARIASSSRIALLVSIGSAGIAAIAVILAMSG